MSLGFELALPDCSLFLISTQLSDNIFILIINIGVGNLQKEATNLEQFYEAY